jgi:nicastrin
VVGCSAPSTAPITGPLLAVTDTTAATEIPSGSVAVISSKEAGSFLQRCATSTELQNTLAGVLILHSPAFPGWNEAPTAPYPAYAVHDMPKSARDYPWNPAGLGLESLNFPFPVFQLDNETSANAVQRLQYNEQIQSSGSGGGGGSSTAINVARMQLTMEGTGNSSNCIASKSCYPLGGYSIWAALPPLPPPAAAATTTTTTDSAQEQPSNSNSNLPILLVISQIDSTSLFHSLTQAADSPLSGLIAMLAAAQALGSVENNNNNNRLLAEQKYKKRIIFLAVMGEPWDFMGSRRLLYELENGNVAVQGLDVDSIEAIIEIGQVGRAGKATTTRTTKEENLASTASGSNVEKDINANNTISSSTPMLLPTTTATSAISSSSASSRFQLFGHVEKTGVSGTAAAPLLSTLQTLATTTYNTNTSLGVVLSNASAITPGLPPSTSSSFLRQRPEIPAVVIEEFDTAFTNTAYHSQYDTTTENTTTSSVDNNDVRFDQEERFDQNGISATAIFLAHALNSLAQSTGITTLSSSIEPLVVNSTAVEETVDQLLGCLAKESPGMGCELVNEVMTPWSSGPAGHYVGILRTVSQSEFI